MASNTRCMPPVIAMLPVASLVPLEFACAPLGLQLESSLVLTATTTAGPQATYYIRHTVRGRVTPGTWHSVAVLVPLSTADTKTRAGSYN